MSEEWTELVWVGIGLIFTAVVIGIIFNFLSLGKEVQAGLYEDQVQENRLSEVRLALPYKDTCLISSEVVSGIAELTSHDIPVYLNVGTETGWFLGKSRQPASFVSGSVSYFDSRTPSAWVESFNSVTSDKFTTMGFKSTVHYYANGDVQYVEFNPMDTTSPAWVR